MYKLSPTRKGFSFFHFLFFGPRLNICYGTSGKECYFENCNPTLPPCIHNFSKKSSEVRQNWNISSDPMDPLRLSLRGCCQAALRLCLRGCCEAALRLYLRGCCQAALRLCLRGCCETALRLCLHWGSFRRLLRSFCNAVGKLLQG
jgi:hypothetical protein